MLNSFWIFAGVWEIAETWLVYADEFSWIAQSHSIEIMIKQS